MTVLGYLGASVLLKINKRGKQKFLSRSRKFIFVAYPYEEKAWRLCNLDTHSIYENNFPYNDSSSTKKKHGKGKPLSHLVVASLAHGAND